MAAPIIVKRLRSLGDAGPRLIFVGGAGSLEIEPGVPAVNGRYRGNNPTTL